MRRALAIALLCAIPAPALAAAAPPAIVADFCEFLNKVIAAGADEFWPLTAAPRNTSPGGTAYNSNVSFDANVRCAVIPRYAANTMEYPPQYSCELINFVMLRGETSLVEPEKVYDETARKLRACFPQTRFEQDTAGRRGRAGYRKTLSRQEAAYRLELRLSAVEVLEREPALIAVQLAVSDTREK